MPPTVLSKPVERVSNEAAPGSPALPNPEEPDEATDRVFTESIAAVKRSFPEWQFMPVHHAALRAYIEWTETIRDAWPLTPRAALHALGFSLRDVRRILNYGTDGGIAEHDVKGREEAVQTRRLVALLAEMTDGDFPAALRYVWEARARLWDWTGGLAVGGKKVDGKTAKWRKYKTGEREEDTKEGAGEKTRVKRRMKPKLMPRYCTPDNIKIAIILGRRDVKKREKDQEAKKDEDWPEEEPSKMREAAYLALQDALGNTDSEDDPDDPDGPDDPDDPDDLDDLDDPDDGSLIAQLLATDADRRTGRDSPDKQRQTQEAGASFEQEVKDRKDSKTQAESSSTDATKEATEDEGATMNAIMAAAQDLGDPSLTEDGPSSLTFDTARFTDQIIKSMGLTRRDPPLHLTRRSKRFLPTAAQDLLHKPDKLHRHFYHARSDAQLMVEMSANYAHREAQWQEYLADCMDAQKMPLCKKVWAQSQGVSLQHALFGDVVDGALRPDCCWSAVRDCMQGVAESWRGVWESHLRRAWGEFAMARADEVFERTDRA